MRETTECRTVLRTAATGPVVLVPGRPLWIEALRRRFEAEEIATECHAAPGGPPGTALLDARGAGDGHMDSAAIWAEAGWRTILVQDAVCLECSAFLRSRGIEAVPEGLSLAGWDQVIRGIVMHRDLGISPASHCPREPLDAGLLNRLSPREREVVRLIAEGYRTREVAKRLWISPRTAETHRLNALRKLEAATTADLVRIAVQGCLV